MFFLQTGLLALRPTSPGGRVIFNQGFLPLAFEDPPNLLQGSSFSHYYYLQGRGGASSPSCAVPKVSFSASDSVEVFTVTLARDPIMVLSARSAEPQFFFMRCYSSGSSFPISCLMGPRACHQHSRVIPSIYIYFFT